MVLYNANMIKMITNISKSERITKIYRKLDAYNVTLAANIWNKIFVNRAVSIF